jgi:nitrogen fixation protein FixH
MTDAEHDHAGRGPRWSIWPGAIFALLGMNVAVVAVTTFLALGDSSVGVEPNYYEKAVDWDRIAAQRDRSAALGWTVEVVERDGVSIVLRTRDGTPISGARMIATVFHHARSAERAEITLTERDPAASPGEYTPVERVFATAGLWELRLIVDHAGERFTADVSAMLEGTGAS